MADSWHHSPLLGRAIASVGEVVFAGQVAVFVDANWRRAVLGGVVAAECLSFAGVALENYAFFVCEETLWACCGLAVLARSRLRSAEVRAVLVAYLGYMVFYDIPMYARRYRASPGGSGLGLRRGLADATACRVVSTATEAWRPHFVWMSWNYTAAPLLSLACAVAARRERTDATLKSRELLAVAVARTQGATRVLRAAAGPAGAACEVVSKILSATVSEESLTLLVPRPSGDRIHGL